MPKSRILLVLSLILVCQTAHASNYGGVFQVLLTPIGFIFALLSMQLAFAKPSKVSLFFLLILVLITLFCSYSGLSDGYYAAYTRGYEYSIGILDILHILFGFLAIASAIMASKRYILKRRENK